MNKSTSELNTHGIGEQSLVFRFQITEETGRTFPVLVVTQLPITKETQSLIGNHDSRNFTAQVYQFRRLELSGLLLESTIQRGALT